MTTPDTAPPCLTLPLLYWASGARSALAVKTLQALGYEDVAHLEGGLSAWKAAGHRTTDP